MRRKLEREMAVDAEAEPKRVLMRKESDADMVASAASAAAAVSAATVAALQRRTMSEEDEAWP